MSNSNFNSFWEEHRETIVVTAVSALSGFLARKILHLGWEGVMNEKPPKNPDSPEVAWKEAIAWTITASLFAGLFRLIARRETHEVMDSAFTNFKKNVG